MEEITIVGVDLAKSVFQIHAANADGRAIVRKRLPRARFLSFMSLIKPCVVAMEACATSHHWARELTALGHDVRLIPPIYVKPFVKRQKNDANDAEAIVEAAIRPSMRTVPVKSPEQQALAMLFRTRELLLTQKTQLMNALRAHLAEHGIIVAGGRRSIDPFIRVLDDLTNTLPDVVRKAGALYLDRIARTSGEIEALERQIDEHANEHEMAKRLRTIPGVGPVTAMAVEAFAPGMESFARGRDFSAWLGLVPRQHWRQAPLGANFENGAARYPPVADQWCDVDHPLEGKGRWKAWFLAGPHADIQITDADRHRPGQQACQDHLGHHDTEGRLQGSCRCGLLTATCQERR